MRCLEILSFSCLLLVSAFNCSVKDKQQAEVEALNKPGALTAITQGEDWKNKAEEMVERQIKARGVADSRVLRAMKETPRHRFVPASQKNNAYMDRPLPIGYNQTISQPYIVALMTELLQLAGDEKVLEIGTGSGYQAAILAPLVDTVYTIEIVEPLAKSSKKLLKEMGYDNIITKWGDGYQGWPEHAPFDAIILTAAPDKVPPKLIEQLKPGGRMVLPVGDYVQELKVIIKRPDGKIVERSKGGVRFVPMIHPKDTSFNKNH